MPLVFRTEENLVDEDRDFFIVVRYNIFTNLYRKKSTNQYVSPRADLKVINS